jgi:S1-C subfamily serine protease
MRVFLAGSLLIAAVAVGVAVGHLEWTRTLSPNARAGFPFPRVDLPGGGSLQFPSFGQPPSNQASGGPANASQIESSVDPALVDVSSTFSYQSSAGRGTGIVLTSNGEVLTNNHVVDGATSISVTDVGNGTTYNATVVGYDESKDLAVLQLVGAKGLRIASTGDSSKLSVGEAVLAIGNAEGLGGTPSAAGGTITALGTSITANDDLNGTSEKLTGLIATNADVQPGDSGGPLVNGKGQVIGMDTAASTSPGFQFFQGAGSQGYAIPINKALKIARAIEYGEGSSSVHVGPTAFLGVQLTSQSSSPGVLVESVVSGGAAAKAGIVSGDHIEYVAGHMVSELTDIQKALVTHHPGDTIVVRGLTTSGQAFTLHVHLASGPPA